MCDSNNVVGAGLPRPFFCLNQDFQDKRGFLRRGGVAPPVFTVFATFIGRGDLAPTIHVEGRYARSDLQIDQLTKLIQF